MMNTSGRVDRCSEASTPTFHHLQHVDAATEFSRPLLGFEVVADNDMSAMMGRPCRWRTMSLPGQSGFEIVLQEPAHWMEGEALARTEAALGVQPQIILSTDDVSELHARLQAAGVPMPMGDPGTTPWGRGLLFEDPSGSKIYLLRPTARP